MKIKGTRYLTYKEIKYVQHRLVDLDLNIYKLGLKIGVTHAHLYKVLRGDAPLTNYIIGLLKEVGINLEEQ